MSMNAVRKRIEALEEAAAHRKAEQKDAELLSPRDVAFLMVERKRLDDEIERQRLNGESDIVSAILIDRIDEMFKSHRRAVKIERPEPPSPAESHAALVEAHERTEADEEEFHRQWLERLGAERDYVKEVLAELDSLKG